MVLLRLTSKPRERSEDFTTIFSSGLLLDYDPSVKYEVALINLSMYYNYYNISAYLGNNIFKYTVDVAGTVTEYSGTYEDGLYTFQQIFDQIDVFLEANGHVDDKININASNITGKVSFTTKDGFAVSFLGTKLHEIFGFNENQVLPKDSTTESPHHADITRGVDSVSVNCSLTAQSYENGISSNTVYTFSPSASPGSLINISPSTPIYVKTFLSGGDPVKSIRISIEDGHGRPIKLNQEAVSVLLDLRPIQTSFDMHSKVSDLIVKMTGK
jgi:hypothetical protein